MPPAARQSALASGPGNWSQNIGARKSGPPSADLSAGMPLAPQRSWRCGLPANRAVATKYIYNIIIILISTIDYFISSANDYDLMFFDNSGVMCEEGS
jgi:hypothetical protein